MSQLTPEEKEICARWWADRLQIKEKRGEFQQALSEKLENNMILEVDYDPKGILLEAIREIGIECKGLMFSARDILPEKTYMKIRYFQDEITVKEGYGAPDEVLI